MIVASAPTHTTPQIEKMKERHHEIKRRLVAGDRQVDIAKSMNMTQSWLSIITSSPVFEAELAKERALADENAADIGGRITRLAPDAMSVLEEAVRKKVEGITPPQRTTFALKALEIAGHAKPAAAPAASANVSVQIVQYQMPAAASQSTKVVDVKAEVVSEK